MYRTNAYKKWQWAGAALVFTLWPLLGHADKGSVLNLNEEPPRVRTLLEEARKIELSVNNSNETGRAAMLYCDASRFGSIEAQYRLGLLYASGKGVPENRVFAATMFSLAAQQGHAHAFEMLETVQLHAPDLPACMTGSSELPERHAAAVSLY